MGQTDESVGHEIVDRMGPAFDEEVFAPAIEDVPKAGTSCEDIRDTLRKEWKPATSRT